MGRIRFMGLILVAGLSLGPASGAQPTQIQYQPAEDSPIGERNPEGAADLKQFEFLAGDWKLVVSLQQPGKEPHAYEAVWHNHWVANGYVMMQEWRGPYATGIELRSFNNETKRWDGRNIYQPSPGTWYENEAQRVGEEMVVTTHKKTGNGKPYLNREIYHSIKQDSFSIRTEVSLDDGATWRAGRYSLDASRAKQ